MNLQNTAPVGATSELVAGGETLETAAGVSREIVVIPPDTANEKEKKVVPSNNMGDDMEISDEHPSEPKKNSDCECKQKAIYK